MAWQSFQGGLEYGGYAAWEMEVEAARGSESGWLVPVMATLVPADGLDLKGAIDQTLGFKQAEFAPHERDLLVTERSVAGAGWPHEVRFVAYVPRASLRDLPACWKILGLGPGFRPCEATPAAPVGNVLTALPGRLRSDVPVMAIIDEGIGFLNARFRAGLRATRFLAVWFQVAERIAQGPIGPTGDIRLGRVLTGAEINAHLKAGAQEAEVYAQVARAIYPVSERSVMRRRVGHGTHVLDLACGAVPEEPMSEVPILAVQLPPSSIRETAGRRMEAHLVQGLRWILAVVLRQADAAKVPPVVLNLSLGTLAGPGDASEFLADWIAHEIDRHRRMAPGAEVRITGSFGNARLSRLVARAEVRLRQPLSLDWRLQPDDGTASFLELRVDGMQASGLALTLDPPVGSGLPQLQATWPEAPGGWMLKDAEGPIARVSFRIDSTGRGLLHLALAPSVPTPGQARALPGLWRITLQTVRNEPVRVVARVQRDDTPFGHAAHGRQSWLDHPEGWTWDVESRGYTLPQPQVDGTPPCPVTREGTYVAFGGSDRDEVWLVGSARPGQVADEWRPSSFSAEGADHLHRPGEAKGPDLVARGETGGFLGGIPAAGLVSGCRVRLSGTSMAAPQVARRLLEYFRSVPIEERNLAAERAALVGKDGWGILTGRRLGHGILT
jgi:hypothetical protein